MENKDTQKTQETKEATEVKKYEWYGYCIKGGFNLHTFIEPSSYIFKRQDSWDDFIESLKIDKHNDRYKKIIEGEEEKQAKLQKYIDDHLYMTCLAKEINKKRNKIIDSKKMVDRFVKARNALNADQTNKAEFIDGLFEANVLRT